jgi:hypothetical protein
MQSRGFVLSDFELDPEVPTHEARPWNAMHRQRWGMHELLVGTHNAERREVSSNRCEIVDAGERTVRTIGVGMDESLHA